VRLFDFLTGRTGEDDFAHKVVARLAKAGWPHRVGYDRVRFRLLTDDQGAVLNLDRLYEEWLACPRAGRSAMLDRAIAPVVEAGLIDDFEHSAPKLIPLVRNLTELQLVALDAEPPDLETWQICRAFAGPLVQVVGVDLPHTTGLLPKSQAVLWGKSHDELFDIALANLIARSPVRFAPLGDGLYLSDYEDSYDSSRLLLPELFLALQLPGHPVAVVLSRHQVVVAGSDSTGALDAMAAYVVQAFRDNPRPLAYQPLILRDRQWTPFEPRSGPIRELAVRQRVRDYGVQTTALERYMERLRKDVFIAPLEVNVLEGEAYTWSSWTETVPALLPRADGLGLTAADGRTLVRTWDAIEAACGPFTPDDSFHPVRYRASAWPSPEAWARLEAEFTTPEWWEKNLS
jgi:hypothetical protein